ncbi:MAG: hypothetical protein DMF61_21775 [Blastocatellia bacterium AA13]|nr:MAG: hypothetical protein DMF61_21775 [Blastocatellia bacterium AA13]
MKCPGFLQLIDYLENRLEKKSADVVAAHLTAGCERCLSSREWYERVRTVADSDLRNDPPTWVVKRAIRTFEGRPVQPRTSPFGRIVASLLFDSFARPLIAGVRSTETANRQLLYEAGDYNIDLQINCPDQNRGTVWGQVLRKDEIGFQSVSGVTLKLTRKGRSSHTSSANDFGEFALNAVPVGEYDLEISTGEGKIIVSPLSIKSH